MTEISNLSMVFLYFFLLIPLSLSYFYALGLSRTLLWAAFRGSVQLFAVGFVLLYLFSLDDWLGISLMIAVMLVIAAYQAGKRGEFFRIVRPALFFILLFTETVILGLWLLFGIIDFQAEKVIPMSGMIIGNSMVASGLALERLDREMRKQKGKIMAALALGATSGQACKPILRATVGAALIPNIDGLKTIGIVQLPGMMTGLILAGASPVEAVRYQLVISISIFASVSLCAMLVTSSFYRFYFNRDDQLRV